MKRSIPMILFLTLAAIGLVLAGSVDVRACDGCQGHSKAKAAGKAPKVFDEPPPVGTRATCPVMGGEFEVKADTARSEHKGKHVVFCCPMCKPKFDKDPDKYL